jgi:MSHA biogenesis protein MshP
MRISDLLQSADKHRNAKKMRGFSLVSAIFLLVVLAALGVAMVSVSSVQNQSSAMDVQGVRAYQAARAGIEWGLYQQQIKQGCTTTPLSANITFPAGTSLAGFTASVSCIHTSDVTSSALDTYVMTSTACNQPDATGTCTKSNTNNRDYVQRVVEVRL